MPAITSIFQRKWVIYIGAIAIFLLIAVVAGRVIFFSRWFTHYIESDAFRAAMKNETAKGLHFPTAHYSAIRRTGSLTAQSESFQASNGERALKSLDARDITAKFNPWGLFVRQWSFSDVHVGSGDVEIQIYEAHPEAIKPKPWFAIFLPNRVFLKRIESEHSNVTWLFRGERAGFFGTQLLITPQGPDFEYRATGGTLKMALVPDLYLRGGHLLVTNTLLTIYDVDLAPNPQSDGSIHGRGTSGMGKDKSVDFKASFDRVPIRTWLPAKWKEHLSGSASGEVHWAGENPKLESSSGEGLLRARDARVENLPLLEKLAELAQKKSFEHLDLSDCSLSFAWRYPKIEIKDITLEEKGKFRIEGAISIDHSVLHGAIKLGLTHPYLDWLPHPEEVFTTDRGGYLWTTVHLSGTVDQPKQDLSPRIVDLFKQSPAAYLGLLFRQFEAWLKQTFGGD
jgi:hypothetical protein